MDKENIIQSFIQKKIEGKLMVLPWFYPENGNLEDFQDGYKIPEEEEKEGGFKKSWWVVCSNYFADPFFIDIDEKEQGFPVYFSWHGQGKWMQTLVAPSLVEFEQILTTIQGIESDKERYLAYINENFDLKNPFWGEVYESILEQEDEIADETPTPKAPTIFCELLITDLGTKKMEVIAHLKEHFSISTPEALSLSKKLPIKYNENFQHIIKIEAIFLEKLGAKVLIRETNVFY